MRDDTPTNPTNIEDFWQDYNWQEAFTVCARKPVSPCLPGMAIDLTHPDIEHVCEIIALDNGQNDESDWVGVFKLLDGRFLSISAWCDYTGWG